MVLADPAVAGTPAGVDAIDDDVLAPARAHGALALVGAGDDRASLSALLKARAAGLAVVHLPPVPSSARWIVAAAGAWDRAGLAAAGARTEAVASLARAVAAEGCLASCSDRVDSLAARWALRAWRPCGWCEGGGVRSARCARCGAPLAEDA